MTTTTFSAGWSGNDVTAKNDKQQCTFQNTKETIPRVYALELFLTIDLIVLYFKNNEILIKDCIAYSRSSYDPYDSDLSLVRKKMNRQKMCVHQFAFHVYLVGRHSIVNGASQLASIQRENS